MNSVIDLENGVIDYISQELANTRTTFDFFNKLVDTIKKLDAKLELVEKSGGNYLVISEDDIL